MRWFMLYALPHNAVCLFGTGFNASACFDSGRLKRSRKDSEPCRNRPLEVAGIPKGNGPSELPHLLTTIRVEPSFPGGSLLPGERPGADIERAMSVNLKRGSTSIVRLDLAAVFRSFSFRRAGQGPSVR